jgi:hypothetical protein
METHFFLFEVRTECPNIIYTSVGLTSSYGITCKVLFCVA